MLLITKHSRFHRAVVSAAALMTVAGGIAEALPLSAEAQTFSYPQPTAPQPTPGYPYLQQPPTAQGVDPYGHSYPYYPQPTAPPTAPAYPYQLHQQQPMAQGTTDQLNREELGRLQSGNGYSPYYSASGSPPGWGWGSTPRYRVLGTTLRVQEPRRSTSFYLISAKYDLAHHYTYSLRREIVLLPTP